MTNNVQPSLNISLTTEVPLVGDPYCAEPQYELSVDRGLSLNDFDLSPSGMIRLRFTNNETYRGVGYFSVVDRGGCNHVFRDAVAGGVVGYLSRLDGYGFHSDDIRWAMNEADRMARLANAAVEQLTERLADALEREEQRRSEAAAAAA